MISQKACYSNKLLDLFRQHLTTNKTNTKSREHGNLIGGTSPNDMSKWHKDETCITHKMWQRKGVRTAIKHHV